MPRIETEVELEGGWLQLRGRPVKGRVVVTAFYGEPRPNIIGFHTGQDSAPVAAFPPDSELEIVPVGEGLVEWLGVAPAGPAGRNVNGGLGNFAQVVHPDGERTRYCHLREFSPRIRAWIAAGYDPTTRPYLEADEVLGIMGNVGFVYGAGGAVPGDGDLVTGRHLHYEHLDAAGLVNPLSRLVDVPEVTFRTQTTTRPVSIVSEPPPQDLSLVPAWNEARLLKRLIGFMLETPLPGGIGEALDVIAREAEEIVAAHGSAAGATLDEARILAQTCRLLRDAGAPEGYVATLERMRDEAQQLADAIKGGTPA